MKRWSRGAAVVAVVALTAVGGCSSAADRLDRSATEDTVAGALETELGQPVVEVVCPDDIPRGEGETVRCEATLVAVDRPVRLDATQVAGDELDVVVVDAVVDPFAAADELEQQLTATYLRSFTADCGGPDARVVAPGSTLSCSVADDEGSREVTVTVVDSAGSLEFSVADVDDPVEGDG